MRTRCSRLLPLIMAVLCLAASAWAADQLLTVQVREVQMRTAPSFTGGLSATLSYGQTVSVLEEQGVWTRVSGAGGTGWVHKSALTSQRLALSSGSRDAASKAGDREVAMAGKGFNAETEQAYRQGHPEGYAQVEAMLRVTYAPTELNAFLAAGRLVPRQEGAR